jgi:hypothetical protein
LNFIFGIVCSFVCVCAFSLRRESPDMILGDKPLIFEVVLLQSSMVPPREGIVCAYLSWSALTVKLDCLPGKPRGEPFMRGTIGAFAGTRLTL